MKFFFTLMLTAILFVTQTWSLCLYAGQGVQKETLPVSQKDQIFKIALDIEKEGIALQNLQDSQGIEVARQYFDQMANENLEKIFLASEASIHKMSEEEAGKYLDIIGKHLGQAGEDVLSILSDRSLSNKEKLVSLQGKNSSNSFKEAIEGINSRALVVGYEAAFKEISDQFRNRYDSGGYWGDTSEYPWVFVAIAVVGVLLVYSSTPFIFLLSCLLAFSCISFLSGDWAVD